MAEFEVGKMRNGWYPSHVLAGPGDLGSWAVNLGGSRSPCCRLDFGGRRLLYIIGAEGRRADDGGPAWRRLGALEMDAAGRLVRDHGPVIGAFPHGDPEEGIFGAAPVVDGGELRMYVGEIYGEGGQVDVRTALYRSTDGLHFGRVRTVTEVGGAEIGPLAAYPHGGTDHLIEFHKQVPGWRSWQVGVDGRQVEPLITARGISGPYPLPGGGMALLVRHDGVPGTMPSLAWWSFYPGFPWRWQREDWPVPPCAVQAQLGPDGMVYVRDSPRDASARILALAPIEEPTPLELATPYNLHSDPRAWPATAEIADVRFEGRNLRIFWRGVSDWGYHLSDTGRAMYGHLVAIVRHEGRWIMVGFEHLANRAGGPLDEVDTIFEGHAQLTLGPNHTVLPGETVYLLAAAPCRVGGGVDFPEDMGLLSQRTGIVRVTWGEDGWVDVEPDYWWPGAAIIEEDDDMPYLPEAGHTETIKLEVPEGEPGAVERVPFGLVMPVHADLLQIDRALAADLDGAFMRLNVDGFTVATSPPGVPGVPQHRRPVTVQELVLVVNRPPGCAGGGTVRVIVSGERA